VEVKVETILRALAATAFVVFVSVISFAAEAPIPGGTLRIAAQRDLSTLNPFMRTISFDHNLRTLIYESLVVEADYKVEPGLAASWEISKDGKEYVFHLRRGVVFHDGKPMTSEDVHWSLDHARNPKSRAFGRASLPEIQAIETPEPLVIRIRLKDPFAPFLAILTSIQQSFPVVSNGSLQPGEQPKAFPAGTGPYRFDQWQAGSRITLKKNPGYWQKGIPYTDTLVFHYLPEEEVRFAALRSGDVDVAERVPSQHVDAIQKGKYKGLNVSFAEGASMKGLVFNTAVAPFHDVRVRQAFAYAIDKKEVIRAAYWGLGIPVNQKTHPGSPWHFDVPDRNRDVEKARSLLQQAGHASGLKVKTLVYQGTEQDAQIVQKQLRDIGVEIDLQVMTLASYLEAIQSGNYVFGTFGGDSHMDPDANYYVDFHTERVRNRNMPGYSNPKVDALLERGRVTMDTEERKRVYREVIRILNDEVPVIWLAIGPYAFVYHSHVQGLKINKEGRYFAGDSGYPFAWIKKR
jgi:peptide/nickel transport system substrate-binding protein